MIKNYLTSLKQEFSGYNTAKLMKDIMAGLTVCAQYSAALRSRFPAPQAR